MSVALCVPPPSASVTVTLHSVDGGICFRVADTGLGLSITKNYVNALKGTIELESTAGKGARFTVTLPAL